MITIDALLGRGRETLRIHRGQNIFSLLNALDIAILNDDDDEGFDDDDVDLKYIQY